MRRLTLIFILVCVTAVPLFRLRAEDAGRTYTVQRGDTLFSIANRFGTSVAVLQQANQIGDTDLIYVGQVLRIPGAVGPTPANAQHTVSAPAAPPIAPPSALPPGDYVVQAGDTLAQIARRYNTTIAAIQQVNQLDNANVIYVGQVLHVPGATAMAGAPAATGSVSAYPVVPWIGGSVYAHASQLVEIGRRSGNRLNVFSKVGDSITASSYFLVPVGAGGLRIGAYGNLLGVVNFFSQTTARTNNSFANLSLAAHGTWTTADVLNPGWATPGVCQSGETPLDCELRVTRPSVALIMFGANDVARVPLDQFRNNLNTIVAITERHGVIPVLSTTLNRLDRPDLAGRIDSYNAVVAEIARAHSDPLWNYWLATSGLPNSGLSGDKVHPSLPGDQNTAIFDNAHLSAGATVRNLTALQVLDALYSSVLH